MVCLFATHNLTTGDSHSIPPPQNSCDFNMGKGVARRHCCYSIHVYIMLYRSGVFAAAAAAAVSVAFSCPCLNKFSFPARGMFRKNRRACVRLQGRLRYECAW